MQTRLVNEASAPVWLVDGPARKNARVVLIESVGTFLLIALGVRLLRRPWRTRHRIHHTATCERTIHSRRLTPYGNSARRFGVRAFTLPVVKIEQHGRALGGRDQEVLELAKHVRPDHIALVCGYQVVVGALADKNVEVVEPKIG